MDKHLVSRPLAKNRIIKHKKHSDCHALVMSCTENFQPSSGTSVKIFTITIKKPIRIYFFTCHSPKIRDDLILSQNAKDQGLTFSCFDQEPFLTKSSTLDDFIEITNLIKTEIEALLKEVKKINNQSNSVFLNLESNFKDNCKRFLWKIFPLLETCFFLNNSTDSINDEWSNEVFMAHILFACLCYFLLKDDYLSFRVDFRHQATCIHGFLTNAIPYEGYTNFSKIAVTDLLFQLVFLKDQFKEEAEVWNFICANGEIIGEPLNSKSAQLLNHISELMMAGYKKIAAQMEYNEFCNLLNRSLNKVFLVHLPISLSGLTCFNSNILIRFPIRRDVNLSHIPTKAFILMTFLHEFGHIIERKHLTLKCEWFNYDTPKSLSNQIVEAGDNFVTGIFGSVIYYISYYGSLYLLNIENWRKNTALFRKNFFHENSKEHPENKSEYESQSLKQAEDWESIPLIGRCKRQNDY